MPRPPAEPARPGPDAPAPVPAAEQRARLLQLAYTILCPTLGRRRRALIAGAAVDGATAPGSDGAPPDADYPAARARVVRRALAAGRRRSGTGTRPAGRRRSAPATDPEIAWLLPAARAAYALRHIEGLGPTETRALLAAAGVGDPGTATDLADRIRDDPGAAGPPAAHEAGASG